MKKISLLTMVLVAMMVGLPSVAAAQSSGQVVLFLTEVVEEDISGATPGVSFWWESAQTPQWTRSDEVIFAALREAGVEPQVPRETNISRIYRRPHLSPVNAAQLGALMETDRVLVGTVEYKPLERLAPLGSPGVLVRADVELIAAGSADGVSLQRFTVERRVFGRSDVGLLEKARAQAGQALGEVIGYGLKSTGGNVGVASDATLLALRNVERARYLEEIRDRLLALEEVHEVRERWASEGVIALEINPGEPGTADVVDYVFRVLEHHEFDEFRVLRHDRPVADGVAEFWVEPFPARR